MTTDDTSNTAASTQTFRATGLTCGHCAHAVTDELSALDGVDSVEPLLFVLRGAASCGSRPSAH